MKIRFAYAIAAVAMMAATACQPNKTKSQGTQAEPTQTARQDTASREDEPKISFTMADMNGNNVAVADEFAKLGEENNLKIHVMHEDIFNSMHRI